MDRADQNWTYLIKASKKFLKKARQSTLVSDDVFLENDLFSHVQLFLLKRPL